MNKSRARAIAVERNEMETLKVFRFTLGLTVIFGLILGLAWQTLAWAAGAPSEASGHDLYRRGLYEEAMAEWRRAADGGDAGAAFRLGEEYFDAKVVTRDIDKSVKYLSIGAEGGEPRAQMDLATMYDHGWGVPKDITLAAKWYLEAANNGMPEAQYNIGTMYQTGDGVDQDLERAYMYFLMAVENGFAHFAVKEIESLSQEMSVDQIKNATRMARDFRGARKAAMEAP